MKKLLIIIFSLICSNSIALEKNTNFKDKIFKKQNQGKIIVINSWNEFCTTCKKQINIGSN